MRIVAAAIRWEGEVHTGRRHDIIIHRIARTMGKYCKGGEQGFVTDDGTFVDREEGLKIALASGQLDMSKKIGNKNQLFSEDIYNTEGYTQDKT